MVCKCQYDGCAKNIVWKFKNKNYWKWSDMMLFCDVHFKQRLIKTINNENIVEIKIKRVD